jgi:hypothetical protein
MIRGNVYAAPMQQTAQHATAVAQMREAQEVQAMVFMAKQFPRDEFAAINRILTACKNPALANAAIYKYAKGGSKVEGPSIRLAEAMAKAWGNIDTGTRVLHSDEKSSELESFCWDLETNYRVRKTFTVSHIRHTNKGDYLLTDPREIYETQANSASRRQRACILAVIPGDVADAAVEQCRKTQEAALKGGGKKTIEETLTDIVKAFEGYGVTVAMLEAYLGHNLKSANATDVVNLRSVFRSLRDGMGTVEDHFGAAMARVENKAKKRTNAAALIEADEANADKAIECEADVKAAVLPDLA